VAQQVARGAAGAPPAEPCLAMAIAAALAASVVWQAAATSGEAARAVPEGRPPLPSTPGLGG
jgi:hypothetical protein